MLASIIAFFAVTNEGLMIGLGVLALICNTYFTLYEFLQLIIQRLAYFKSVYNMLDVIRCIAIYGIVYARLRNLELQNEIIATMFLVMWVKIITYLTVFKCTRYLIKMILEILVDIQTFLIILFMALLAYAQIMWSIDNLTTDPDEKAKNSYALALGELGDFNDFTSI